MSAVAAVPLRPLNHAFLPLFVCCEAGVDEHPRPTYRMVQNLPCEGRTAQLSGAGGAAEVIGPRGLLPGEAWLAAAEMAVCCGPREDRISKLQAADDGARPEVEVFLHQRTQSRRVRPCGTERLDHYADGVGDADRVGHLDQASACEACRDEVLRHPPCGVGARAVDLGRVLAREGAPAVRGRPPVGIHDDLASRKA